MPSRIPVQIAGREFRSINQARLNYCGILHDYQPGQSVNQEDFEQVFALLASSGIPQPMRNTLEIRVVNGTYGRRCFANVFGEKDVRMISIIRSVKACAVPVSSTPESQQPAPDGQMPTP